MGSGTTFKKVFPTDTKSIIATVLTGGAYNFWRGAGQLYKSTDPLGEEAQKKALQKQQDDAERKRAEEAAAQAAALKAQPVQLGPQASLTRKRFISGFARTLNTSPLGLSSSAPGSPASLMPGSAPKALLGQ